MQKILIISILITFLLLWIEYRIDVQIEKNSKSQVETFISKLDSLNSKIIYNDSIKTITLSKLRADRKSIDSLILVLNKTKKDTMNLNEALEYLDKLSKK